MKIKYPECEKMDAIRDQSQAIGEFLEWLSHDKNFSICSFYNPGDHCFGEFRPITDGVEQLLAEFFCINLKKIEKEKRQMLDELRKN